MSNATTAARTRPPATAPGGPPIPDDLRVAEWLDPAGIEFGACPDLATAGNVREIAVAVRQMLSRLADSDYLLPSVFVGADSVFYSVEVDVVVRRADRAETREAVGQELEMIADVQAAVTEPALGADEAEEQAEVLAGRADTLRSYLARVGG